MFGVDELGMDLGTSTLHMVVRGKGSVLSEPAYVAYDRQTRNVVAVGEEARRMYGRTPAGLIVERPLRDGRIRSFDLVSKMLRYFLRKVVGKRATFRPKLLLALPGGMAPSERQTLVDVIVDAGVRSVVPVDEGVASAIGAGMRIDQPYGRMNIDIGGGTSNYAVFRAGRVIDTACLNMGGRLAETDGHGWITRVRKPLLPVLEELYGSRAPETLGPDDIPAIADRMAGLIWQVLADERSPLADRLLQTPPLKTWRYDAVTLSGGVGACCAEPEADPFRFRDLGPSLARAIVRHPGFAALPLLPPSQTVRATVIGAGSWMLSLSGATVWADDALLPMRNLPVVFPWLDWHAGLTPAAVETAIGDAMRRMDLGDADRFVVGLPAGMPVAYATVCLLVEAFADFWSRRPEGQPALVALAEDMGKVLGMELRPRLSGRPLVVLDELKLADGDYLDMGKPLYQGGVVPVTIKSLAFSG